MSSQHPPTSGPHVLANQVTHRYSQNYQALSPLPTGTPVLPDTIVRHTFIPIPIDGLSEPRATHHPSPSFDMSDKLHRLDADQTHRITGRYSPIESPNVYSLRFR